MEGQGVLEGAEVLAALLEAQPEGALLLDEGGRVRLLNRRAAELLQVHPAALQGRTLWPWLVEHAGLDPALAAQPPAEFSWEAGPLGQPLTAQCSPLPGGQSVRLSEGVGPHELRARADLLAALLDELPVGSLLVEVPSGRVRAVNRAAQRMVGPLPLVGGLADYAGSGAEHPDGRPYRPEEYPAARAVRGGETVVDEPMRYRRPDGKLATLTVSASRLGGPDGRADFVVVVFNDRSADQARERRLQTTLESREQAHGAELSRSLIARARQASELAAVLESVPAVLYVEGEGGILRANGAAHALFGSHDLSSLNADLPALTRRLNPRDPQSGAPLSGDGLMVPRALAGQAVERELLLHHQQSGEDRLLRVAAAPIREGSGIKAAVVVATDLTEREQARALGRENARLERRVAERAARIAELNAELSAYAVALAADLQEPLRRIGGVLDLLSGQLDDRSARLVDGLRREGERMQALAGDLAALARIGRSELRREPVSLSPLVSQVISDLTPGLHGREVRWQLGPLPTVQGDRMLLRAALASVLDNALKFSGARPEPTIELSAVTQGDEVLLRVRDNGVGFAAEQAPHIFELFAQLHPEQPGTGVGLANVRRIVARHGGRVWAEGAPDAGATIFITLPRAED